MATIKGQFINGVNYIGFNEWSCDEAEELHGIYTFDDNGISYWEDNEIKNTISYQDFADLVEMAKPYLEQPTCVNCKHNLKTEIKNCLKIHHCEIIGSTGGILITNCKDFEPKTEGGKDGN